MNKAGIDMANSLNPRSSTLEYFPHSCAYLRLLEHIRRSNKVSAKQRRIFLYNTCYTQISMTINANILHIINADHPCSLFEIDINRF